MKSRSTVLLLGLAALAADLAGCERHDGRDRDDRRSYDPAPAPAPAVTIAAVPAVDITIVDAAPDIYPERAYYYGTDDADHVYYYDSHQPDVVVYRQVFRDRDRPYYVEHENDRLVERRVFFDDAAARSRRVDREQSVRERLESTAREHDQHERDDWTKRRSATPQRPQHDERKGGR